MKSIATLIAALIILLALPAKAQYVNLPDSAFGSWLNTHGYSACLTGNSLTGWRLDTTSTRVATDTLFNLIYPSQPVKNLDGIQYFRSLRTVMISQVSLLQSIPIMPPVLRSLTLNYCNSLHSLPALPATLTSLNIQYTTVNSVAAWPPSMINLTIYNAQNTSLPALPTSLQNLFLADTLLTALPALPSDLLWLHAVNCPRLTALPTLPSSLIKLDCFGDLSLTSLPALPASLTWLECAGDIRLASLPSLPSSLTYLSVSNDTSLTALPTLPGSLVELYAFNTHLTSLPALPASLVHMLVFNSRLTSLPALPTSLTELDCSKNQLTSLPTLPAHLDTLICDNNRLVTIPATPATLIRLSCNYNPVLTSITSLPHYMMELSCYGDSALTCLPPLDTITYMLNLGNSGITCLSQYPKPGPVLALQMYPSYIPLCGPGNVHSCAIATDFAGPDQTVCATDTAVTTAAGGAGLWAVLPGNPAPSQFFFANKPVTHIEFSTSVPGTYYYTWTDTSGLVDTLVITKTVCLPTAGPDQTVPCAILPGGIATMAATGSGTWTAIPGNPGTSSIAISSSPNTPIANFSAAGTYRYLWTYPGGTDTALVTVTAKPDAGPDQTVNCVVLPGGSATMAATGTGTWTFISGPCTTIITTPSSPTTTITNFSCAGIYTYVWTSGGCTDTVQVTVTAIPNAGPDQTVPCVTSFPGGGATMAAIGTGTWTTVTGNPGTATIANPTAGNTVIVAFSAPGVYSFIWTNGGCTDTVQVTVTTACPANAGADQTICVNGAASMAATGTGTWSDISSNPTSTIITSPASPTTTISGFTHGGIYAFTWTTGTGTDTVLVSVDSLSAYTAVHNIPCDSTYGSMDLYITSGTAPFRDSLSYFYGTGGPRGPVSTIITSLTNVHYTNLDGFTRYNVDITDAVGCTFTVWAADSVRHTPCASDSVWPGDADHNGLVDNNDLLPIGTGYGLNGFTRPDQSIVWSAHYAQDWGMQFVSGENAKHADCNGDGVIDANDTTAILLNFGLTHPKTNGNGAPWRTGIPGITLRYSKDTVVAGDTLITSLILGDSVNTVSNIYGLAFTFHFDPQVIDTNAISFRFVSSFLGNSTNMISIHKDFTNGMVKAAVTGINHLNRSGYGEIARFSTIITTENLNGKDLSYYGNVNYISDIVAIDKNETALTLNAGADSNRVAYEPTGLRDISEPAHITLSPNPATTAVRVSADAIITDIRITDMIGAEVYEQRASSGKSEMIDISGLSVGVYSIHIVTTSGTGTARLTVRR